MARSLSDVAVEHIRTQLLRGGLRPGSRLSELGISQEMGISRTPVREAINQLASNGLVEQIPGVGAFVRIPDDQELAELMELREMLEGFGVSQAASRIDETGMEALRGLRAEGLGLIRQVRQSSKRVPTVQQLEQHFQLDIRFHQMLIEACGNRWIKKIFQDVQLLGRIFAYKHEHPDRAELRSMVRTWREHSQLLRAVEQHDGAEALRLLVMHIRNYPQVSFEKIRYQRPGSESLSAEHLALLRQWSGRAKEPSPV